MSQKVLAVGAHPDDVEFYMAGTLALLKELGWLPSIGILAKGDGGSKVLSRYEIAALRRKEAEKAAGLLGAEVYFMGQNDLNIDVNLATRRIVTEVLRKAAPDMVITHPPMDYMTDHEFTSRLVRDACFAASVPNYETEDADPAPPLDHIPYLFYADAIEGKDIFGNVIVPHFVVDISSQVHLKRDMLACHASQRDWLRAQHGIDQYLLAMEQWAEERGKPYGFAYGEGFVQHRGHAFPQDNLLKTLLGDKVQ
jgi:LmbE family N-acetylglucosaminyl deacetylase